MSSNGGAEIGGDDLSALSGFFFYVFIVHPCTAWILRPGRFEKKKSIMYAIAFLAGLASLKTGLELRNKGPNHYSTLGVSRSSNPLEIKRAYKKLSLQLHPDKNPSPSAQDEFHTVKQAYDTLLDMELREVYNKFGAEGVRSNKRFNETTFFIELGVFYMTWGIMAFVLTLGKKSGDARQWIYTGMIVMLVLEIYLITTQNTNPIPDWLFPQNTEYEAVWLLHSLFPAFMNGCRSLGSFLYVDLDAQGRQLLLALQEQNKDILLVLRDVQIGVQSIVANGVKSGGPAAGSGGVVDGGSRGNVVLSKATPTGKLKELQDRLNSNNSNVAQAVQQLKGDGNKNSSYGFYAMILGYIVFSYIFSS